MRICPKCHEMVGDHAAKCFNCYTELTPTEPEEYNLPEDYENKDVKVYSWKYNFYIFAIINLLLLWLPVVWSIAENDGKPISPFLLFTLFAIPITVMILYVVLGLMICPVCGSLKMHESNPFEVTWHCCCRCGEHIRNHPEFRPKVAKGLGLGIAGLLLPIAIMCIIYSVSGMTGGVLSHFHTPVIVLGYLAIILFVNLVVYLGWTCIWANLFPDE